MTHFEIARRFAGLSGVELAGRLGVYPQQVQGWVSGSRTPSRSSVTGIASELGVDPAWLLGMPQQMAVIDPVDGSAITGDIMRTEMIPAYGVLYHIYLDSTGDIIPVIVGGGVQFTPCDWQTLTVKCADDISAAHWMDCFGRDAVMLDGLPRVIL